MKYAEPPNSATPTGNGGRQSVEKVQPKGCAFSRRYDKIEEEEKSKEKKRC